jgi:hypothetical protein
MSLRIFSIFFFFSLSPLASADSTPVSPADTFEERAQYKSVFDDRSSGPNLAQIAQSRATARCFQISKTAQLISYRNSSYPTMVGRNFIYTGVYRCVTVAGLEEEIMSGSVQNDSQMTNQTINVE